MTRDRSQFLSESDKNQTRKIDSKLACYENNLSLSYCFTAQKMKFSIKNLFSKCDQIRSFLRIWQHLLKKSVMENFMFCEVFYEFRPSRSSNKRRENYIGYLKKNQATQQLVRAFFFLLFLCRTENLIIQWASENVLNIKLTYCTWTLLFSSKLQIYVHSVRH